MPTRSNPSPTRFTTIFDTLELLVMSALSAGSGSGASHHHLRR